MTVLLAIDQSIPIRKESCHSTIEAGGEAGLWRRPLEGMQEKLNIAVFVDYDNIEIGVKSTLRREFDVSLVLDALRERGDIVAKYAYGNWSRQWKATQQMAENAVQMVQRNPSPRGDKNGGDINLALDALEMAFTHHNVNAFAIVSGDSDFIPLVNKLKEYGKTVFVVGGKAFTSTILQKNCHEFIAYESLIEDSQRGSRSAQAQAARTRGARASRPRESTLDPVQVLPLVERALRVLERRNVQPQLGLLKSTMLQLDPRFDERAYGASSFSDLLGKLEQAGYLRLVGEGGQKRVEKQLSETPEQVPASPGEALPLLKAVIERHLPEIEQGVLAEKLENWVSQEAPELEPSRYGFQHFNELLNYAQDKLLVRIEPDEEEGLRVYPGPELIAEARPALARRRRSRRSSRKRASQPAQTPQP